MNPILYKRENAFGKKHMDSVMPAYVLWEDMLSD